MLAARIGKTPKAMSKRPHKTETLLAHLGRAPYTDFGTVNPPVYHASTILFDSLEAYETKDRTLRQGTKTYGRMGTPTSFALEEALADLEGGHRSFLLCSGLAALNVAILSLVGSGGHALVCDAAYQPARKFCDGLLARFGVEVEYYDPLIGADIAGLFRPNTRLVHLESPGSLTFDMQDVPAIAAAAKAVGIRTVMDNTWATFLNFKPLEHGIDVSVQAGTKYLVGHSDAMFGVITCTEESEPELQQTTRQLGQCAGPDDVYLALRGLRTMAVRLPRHQETALALCRWLCERPEVARVLYPALPSDPGHEIWRRDYTGASGLFGFVLARPYSDAALGAMLDGLELFGMGSSWGGFESLMIRTHPERSRTATRWTAPGPTLRIHAGLEDPDDLIADLEAGFDRLTRAAGDGT
jgi:cystathionine beta-lyase